MLDDAALVLEEIAPEDKTRNKVLGACVTSLLRWRGFQFWVTAGTEEHSYRVTPAS